MSARLTKRNIHRGEVISTNDGDANNVTYYSTNNQDGRHFEAVSPPNSVHAQKLAELALLVQSNQRQIGGHKKYVATLPASRKPAPRAAVTYPTPAASQTQQIPAQLPTPYYPPAPLNAPYQDSETTTDGQQYYQYGGQQSQAVGVSASQATSSAYISDPHSSNTHQNPQIQPQDVRRYGTEQQTGYKVKTKTGEMRVSAPIGSSEARAFDGVVEKMSLKEERRNEKEKRLRRKSQSRDDERRGNRWWL